MWHRLHDFFDSGNGTDRTEAWAQRRTHSIAADGGARVLRLSFSRAKETILGENWAYRAYAAQAVSIIQIHMTWLWMTMNWLWIDYDVLHVIGVTRHTSLSCPRAWTAACDWTLQATAKGKDAHPRGDWRSAIDFAIRLSISPLTVDVGKAGSPDPSVTVDRAFLSGNLKVFHVWVRHSEIVRSFQKAQPYIDNLTYILYV